MPAEGADELSSPQLLRDLCPPPLQDLLWAASFYYRFFMSYIPFYSVSGALLLFVAVRYAVQNGRSGWSCTGGRAP